MVRIYLTILLLNNTMKQNKSSNKARDLWSSKLSFILASTGAAVGLGNIWKFPYEIASNGGSAFVVTYVICLVMIGIPVLIAEMLLGKLGRANPINTMKTLATRSHATKKWQFLGWLSIITLLLVLSFYSVVAGWSIIYAIASIKGVFVGIDNAAVNNFWEGTINSPITMISYHALFMLLTISIVAKGITKGLEKANNIMMPMLFLFLIILVCFSYNSSGFTKGLKYLLEFRYQDFNFTTILKALGQTCFTLAIGAGCMLVYGSYVKEETNLGETASIIALVNLAVGILTGLVIFPIIFSFNLEPIGGPGLIFQTLPVAFANIKYGYLFGSMFFLLILFAAWTSSISMAEPIVIMLMEKTGLSRVSSAIITGILTWSLGIISALSFNVWKNYSIFGKENFFILITDLTTDFMLPLGILGFTIFAGWKLTQQDYISGLKFHNLITVRVWHFLIKYLAPIFIILVTASTFFKF